MDIKLFHLINAWVGKNIFLDKLMIFSAKYLLVFIFSLTFIYIFFKKNKKIVYLGFVSGFCVYLVNKLISLFWTSPRPFLNDCVNLLIRHKPDNSFPSDHAAVSMALATMIFFADKKIGLVLIITSILIGFSRIFCGLHYPSDVIAGFFLGWLVSPVIYKLNKPC